MSSEVIHNQRETDLKKSKSNLIAVFFAAASVLHVLYLVRTFLYKYVDSDQLIMADLTEFYSHGIVPEPYFWGQSYLFPVESWFAVPLRLLGIRADIATMIVSISFQGAALVVVWSLLRRHTNRNYSPILLLPLVLPVQFLLVSLMPRNFGTAVSAATIFILLGSQSNSKIKYLHAMLTGLCLGSYLPALALYPFVFKAFKLKYLIALHIGLIFVVEISVFYKRNPEYLVTKNIDLNFAFDNFLKHQVSTYGGFFLILFLSLALVLLTIGSTTDLLRGARIMFCASLLVMVLAFGTNKSFEFQPSVFYSQYRFLVAIPWVVILAAFFSILHSESNARAHFANKTPLGIFSRSILVFILLVFSALQFANYSPGKLAHFNPFPGVQSRSTVINQCNSLVPTGSRIAYRTESNFWLAYGCHALVDKLVILQSGDRRTWLGDYLKAEDYEFIDID